MPNWLLAISTIVTALAGAVKIHETFYPDLATRKRQLKHIGNWLLNIAAVAAQIWMIAGEVKRPMPTTSEELLGTVLKISLSVSMLLFLIQIQWLDYFVGRILKLVKHQTDTAGLMINNAGRMIEVLKNHEKAMVILSASPTLDSETRANLTKLLD